MSEKSINKKEKRNKKKRGTTKYEGTYLIELLSEGSVLAKVLIGEPVLDLVIYSKWLTLGATTDTIDRIT